MLAQEVLIVAVLIFLNGLFAMAELALISCRRARLEQMRVNGDKRIDLILKLLDSPTLFLSTVQMGITVLSIVSGVYGGAHFSQKFAVLLESLPISASARETLALVIVVSTITYFSLVFGEIIPKRLALAYPENIAKVLTPLLAIIAKVLSPLVRLLEWSTEKVLLLAPLPRDKEHHAMTGDEIKYVIEQGAESGALKDQEAEIMSKVFHLRNRSVRSVMTPRTSIVWLDISATTAESWETASKSGFSYFPVCEGDIDQVTGMITIGEFADHYLKNPQLDLRTVIWEPLRVPVTIPLLTLLQKFREAKRHVAIVFDEYGGTKGVVTLHDLLEALIGELTSPAETAAIRERPDGSLLVDAGADMFELQERLGLEGVELKSDGYHSLGGFILNTLGRIPDEAERFDYGGYEFEIVDMDRYRIDKVLVKKKPDTVA